jgi:hypothetical protein
MNIMELGAIGELVGGVAVIASLIFVGVQVRKNTSAIRANSAQGFADSINGAILKLAGGGEPARVWRIASEDPAALTDDERVCADFICLAAFQSYDSGLLQAKLGSLDEDTRDMIHSRIRGWFEFDYYREWWVRNPWKFSEPLMRFVGDECGLGGRT